MLFALLLTLPALLVGYGIYELVDDDDDNGDETLNGDARANNIDGKNGNDLITGAAGNDNIEGGSGNDVIDAGADDDVVLGQQNNDDITGGQGDDLLQGGQGADTVNGGEGDDWVEGNAGADTLDGGAGNDLVLGGNGQDQLSGGTGNDMLFGGNITGTPLNLTDAAALRDGTPLADLFNAAPDSAAQFRDDTSADILIGGDGDDALFLGAGDTGEGGDGADIFALLADQSADGGPALVADLMSDDALVIVTRDGATPDVTVDTDGEDALVSADGALLARVTGAANSLNVEDITIVPAPTINDLDPNA